MALNQDYVGKVYPASPPYEVGREKIREFATAIGDRNPAYHDVDHARSLGHRDVIAPPTFPFVVSMRASAVAMFDPGLGLDYSRVVHGEQRFAYARPVTAGDSLVVVTTIETIRVAAGNDILTTRSDISTEDGEHVVTGWSVTVARGTAEGPA
ncbi:MAG TPA: MaoC family dehydratase N-terminal domain-containing protein [Candidatus Angelobacter sp.]|nr:MaoC family dehydratase N-terminal domain-containing protein [Candidatus Angelobacter sp.]